MRACFGADLDELDDMRFSGPTLDQPHPLVRRTPLGWQTSFPPPDERAPEDELVLDPDYDPEDEEANPDDYLTDPLEITDLPAEDRWPGRPGYRRYCTAAEREALDDWVERQLAPVRAEHQRFFAVIDTHGSDDDEALLLPQMASQASHHPSSRT